LLELVIFDCDGVLVDSEPIACAVLAESLGEIGLQTSAEDCMRDYVGRWWPDSVAMIEAQLGAPLPAGFAAQYRRRQFAALAAAVEPVPGVVEALERIPVGTCVASNGPPEKMEVTLGRAGLLERFQGKVFSAAAVARGKPAPDLFLHAATRMGCDPSACLVVEDSPLGIEAAAAAGMRALGFSGERDPAPLRAAGAETFAEMKRLPELLGFGG